jgi:phospholipid/cholesterol/gamma-HCH transport system substrate-binding protein
MALKREIKVGLFVLSGLVVIGFVVFLIGDERSAFKTKDEYKAVFEDVEGLKRGSSIRMGGVDVST